MTRRARGRIVSWDGGSLWLMRTLSSSADKTSPHAHHAIQVTLGLEGAFALEAGGQRVRGAAVAVAPDTPHAFELDGSAAHFFFEPDGRLGRAVCSALFSAGNVMPLPASAITTLKAALASGRRLSDPALIELGRGFFAQLAGATSPPPTDFRVQRMLAWVELELGASVSLAAAARAVGLSAGRARHVFVEQTGVPFRAFVLWRRLSRALQLYAEHQPLTVAAHRAGFSDSAHLSRTFRRMFGVAAADLWLEAPPGR